MRLRKRRRSHHFKCKEERAGEPGRDPRIRATRTREPGSAQNQAPSGAPRLKDTRSASLPSFLSPELGVKMDPATPSFGKRFLRVTWKEEKLGGAGVGGGEREQPDPLILSAGVQIAFVWGGIESGHTREGERGRWRGPDSCNSRGARQEDAHPSLGGRYAHLQMPRTARTLHPATPAGLRE